jgi:hypothetical protein
VQQEGAVAVDHADAVAETGHDRAEQARLAAALRLGAAQLGGGEAHLVPGAGAAGGQRPGGGVEVRTGEVVVGADPGRDRLQQGEVAPRLGEHRGAHDRGALVHHPVRVLPLGGAQAAHGQEGHRDAHDEDGRGQQRADEPAPAAGHRGYGRGSPLH